MFDTFLKGDLTMKTSLNYGLIWLVQPEYAIINSFLDHENSISIFLHCSICKNWNRGIRPQTLEPSLLSAWNYIPHWWLFVNIKFYKLLSPLQPGAYAKIWFQGVNPLWPLFFSLIYNQKQLSTKNKQTKQHIT